MMSTWPSGCSGFGCYCKKPPPTVFLFYVLVQQPSPCPLLNGRMDPCEDLGAPEAAPQQDVPDVDRCVLISGHQVLANFLIGGTTPAQASDLLTSLPTPHQPQHGQSLVMHQRGPELRDRKGIKTGVAFFVRPGRRHGHFSFSSGGKLGGAIRYDYLVLPCFCLDHVF